MGIPVPVIGCGTNDKHGCKYELRLYEGVDGGVCIAQRKDRWLLMLLILMVIVAAGILMGYKQKEVLPVTPTISDLTLSSYPKLFEKDVIIVVGENATQIEMEGAQAIADNLGNHVRTCYM